MRFCVLAIAAASTPLAQEDPAARVDLYTQEGQLVYAPKPAYPKLARQMRIGGAVSLAVEIDEEGKVIGIELMNGHPPLTPAAMDAVKGWWDSPLLVHGTPVPRLTTVGISFTLGSRYQPYQPGREQPVIHVAQPRDEPRREHRGVRDGA